MCLRGLVRKCATESLFKPRERDVPNGI
jgi:hypothetical protein